MNVEQKVALSVTVPLRADSHVDFRVEPMRRLIRRIVTAAFYDCRFDRPFQKGEEQLARFDEVAQTLVISVRFLAIAECRNEMRNLCLALQPFAREGFHKWQDDVDVRDLDCWSYFGPTEQHRLNHQIEHRVALAGEALEALTSADLPRVDDAWIQRQRLAMGWVPPSTISLWAPDESEDEDEATAPRGA